MKNEKSYWLIIGVIVFIFVIIFFGMNDKIQEKENEISGLNYEIDDLQSKNSELREYNEELQNDKKELKEEMKRKEMIDYNPPLKKVREIVEETDVDRNTYVEGEYNCAEFSYDLVNEFLERDVHSCSVELIFNDDSAHGLVALNTSDKGVIYVEPQDDKIIYNLEKGDDYCEKADWYCKIGEDWEIKKVKSCYDSK